MGECISSKHSYIDSKSNPKVYYSMIFLNPGDKLVLQLGFEDNDVIYEIRDLRSKISRPYYK